MLLALTVGAVASPLLPGAKQSPAAAPSHLGLPPAQPLDDAIEPLVPRKAAGEIDQERLRAVSLFAAGRVLERQNHFAAALTSYGRAFLWDPQADDVATAAAQLALRMRRPDVALRYALKAHELRDADPMLLLELGDLFSKAEQWDRAAACYERVLGARGDERETTPDVVLHMELGRLYQLVEKYAKSADHFARVVYALDHEEEFKLDAKTKQALLSPPAPTYLLFAESFLRAGRGKEALAAFEKADQLAPDKGLLGYHRAELDLRDGKADAALRNLQTYFDLRRTSAGLAPYRLLQEILKRQGKTEELAERLEKIRAADPGNVALLLALADHYREKARFDKAEPLYRLLAKQTPLVMSGYRGLLEIYRKTKRPEPLLTVLGQAAGSGAALDSLDREIRAACDDKPLLDSVLAIARDRFKAHPERMDYGARLAAALLASEAKRFDVAGDFFQRAAQLRPKEGPEILLAWGATLLGQDRAKDAAKVFKQAIAMKPSGENQAAFYYYLAGAEAAQGHADEALAAAHKAAEAKKDSPRFAARTASVLYVLKRYDEALKAYQTLLDRFDHDEEVEETRAELREARLLLSTLCVLKNQRPQAEEWLQQVLDEFPADVAADNDLGFLWAEQGVHLQRAKQMIEAAVQDDPDNSAYRDSLGWVYHQLGQSRRAVAELEKAAAEKKPDPVILDHLGDAYLKDGRPDKARQTWRRAADAYREAKEPEKAKQTETKIHQGK
jgi:tetratricopeptide (TPR) repeat protein